MYTVDVLVHLEADQCEVADVVGAEGEDEDEEGIERYDPEDMLQKYQRAIQTYYVKWKIHSIAMQTIWCITIANKGLKLQAF